MFDVNWTDPDVEKVGDRKARKEKEHESHDGADARLSKRGSTSTRRSSSSADKSAKTQSTAEKTSSWFGSLKKKNRLSAKSKTSHPSELRIPVPGTNTVTPSLPTSSTFNSDISAATLLSDASPESRLYPDAQYVVAPTNALWYQTEDARILQSTDSFLSASVKNAPPVSQLHFQSASRATLSDASAATTVRPWARAAQTFRKDRQTLKNTETPMNDIQVKTETGSDGTGSECTVPTARVPADSPTLDSLIPLDTNPSRVRHRHDMYAVPVFGHPGVYLPSRVPRSTRSGKNSRSSTRNLVSPPGEKGLVRFRAHDPARWKTPGEWDAEEQRQPARGLNQEGQFSNAAEMTGNDSLTNLASVQREIKNLSLLVPASIVFRLDKHSGESSDPSVYQQIEMARKRLLLHALYSLSDAYKVRALPEGVNILALYESGATASYLAAIHPDSTVTHVSPSPLSTQLFPNLRPLVLPAASHSALSLPRNHFSAVYCLPLPSLTSSQEIPGLLRTISASILPGGILHLVVIDPIPATQCLGPRMRQWMEENLLLNLERQFRCTSPRKLIPMWLDDAGLRATSSTNITIKSQAVFRKMNSSVDEGGERGGGAGGSMVTEHAKSALSDVEEDKLDPMYGGHDGSYREQQAKLELQSRVGRMLWQETWGAFVTADRWWWDDARCVDECVKLGTYWEYSIIEAVKDAYAFRGFA